VKAQLRAFWYAISGEVRMAESSAHLNVRLQGWKDIAHHLGVSVRSAQTLEKEQGLPVCRGLGPKAPVFAFAAELDRWRSSVSSAADLPQKAEAEVVPNQRTAALPHGERDLVRRRDWLRSAALGGSAVLTLGAVGTAISKLTRPRRFPTAYRVSGATLFILDQQAEVLWRYTFPAIMAEDAVLKAGVNRCIFADIDADGATETVFLYSSIDGAPKRKQSLYCFNGDGALRWEFVPGKPVTDKLGQEFVPPFWPNSFAVLQSRSFKHPRIVISSNHNWSFPDQVAVLDSQTGRVVSEYWHRGHLLHMALADLDGNGDQEVLLGGVNDAPEHKRATLVIFDPTRIAGASKDPTGKSYFENMPPGNEKRIVFFPRTPLSRAEEFNRVGDVRVANDRVTIMVSEGVTEATAPTVVYEFDFRLKLTNVALSSGFVAHYNALLAHDRKLEPLSQLASRLSREVTIL
jgi:hypothetical protein